jgi:hypothetical protein
VVYFRRIVAKPVGSAKALQLAPGDRRAVSRDSSQTQVNQVHCSSISDPRVL